jgi:uncharacterized protein YqgQ
VSPSADSKLRRLRNFSTYSLNRFGVGIIVYIVPTMYNIMMIQEELSLAARREAALTQELNDCELVLQTRIMQLEAGNFSYGQHATMRPENGIIQDLPYSNISSKTTFFSSCVLT